MHEKNPLNLNWSRNSVVYQVYPRSYKDSNGDGVGDLQGIIDKIDYLNDGTENSLGIGALWISPFYKSPMKDFGYDVSDYRKIDPIFGNMETFEKLIEELDKRNMKLIMDFVPNHTSDQHEWFLESKSSKENPKRDWYIWKDPKKDGSPPNNWISVFGGPAWKFDETTGQYYLHTFLPEQPDLNWRNPDVADEMLDTLDFWLHKGVDGFRTDAVYYMLKDPEFKDDPINPDYIEGVHDPYEALLHENSQGHPEILDKTKAFCTVIADHNEGDSYMLSEVYIDIPEMEHFYAACKNNLHAPFNFNLIGLPWDAQSFKKEVDDFEASLSENDWPNYVLGNHDQPRIASVYGHKEARLLAMMLLTLRGLPFIYYGDELGMENVPIKQDQVKDPFGIRVPGFTRDPYRTPIQWNADTWAGFSETEPWLPLMENFKEINVEKLSQDPQSILNLYKKLIHLRKDSLALKIGCYKSFDHIDHDVFGYDRSCHDETLIVLLNFSNHVKEIYLNEFGEKNATIIIDTLMKRSGEKIFPNKLILQPLEGLVLKINEP